MTKETLRLERRECFDPAALPLGMVAVREDGEWLGLVQCEVDARLLPLDPSPRYYHARLLIGGEWWDYREGVGLSPADH